MLWLPLVERHLLTPAVSQTLELRCENSYFQIQPHRSQPLSLSALDCWLSWIDMWDMGML